MKVAHESLTMILLLEHSDSKFQTDSVTKQILYFKNNNTELVWQRHQHASWDTQILGYLSLSP